MTAWESLAARARGLSTHLLTGERIREIERAGTPGEVASVLRSTAYAPLLDARAGDASAVERAVARSLAMRLALLARWESPGHMVLRAVWVAQDARNLRSIVRGVVGALPPERRIAGCVPTPLLGRKELEALGAAESVPRIGATLRAWGHPLGPALAGDEEGRGRGTDAYRLEVAIARRAAAEATAAARQGGSHLRAFVREEIDADNVATAYLLAGASTEGSPGALFLEGGERLGSTDFVRAATAPDREASAAALARALSGSALGEALAGPPASPADLVSRIVVARLEALERSARRDPVSALPVLWFLVRLYQEGRVVRRAAWRAALGGGPEP